MFLVLTLLLGIGYPFAVWGISQIAFPNQANGSLITKSGKVVGLGTDRADFTSAGYFHSRPSAAGNGYDAGASSGSNLGPTSKKLIDRIKTDTEALQAENPMAKVPADLVTTSGSGLDPHISPGAPNFRSRAAKERRMSENELLQIVSRFSDGRQYGFFGEPRVNVLLLNLELDKLKPSAK